MSYDLMVFEPSAAPTERAEFMEWYRVQMERAEGLNDVGLAHTTPGLRALYRSMVETFPDMNGPEPLGDDVDVSRWTDYDIRPTWIYVAFRWSVASEAYAALVAAAHVHGVGFFDVSATDGDIIFPTKSTFGNSMDELYRLVEDIVPPETMDEVRRMIEEHPPS